MGNFNHLIDEKKTKAVCKYRDNRKNCYWKPTSNIRATVGKNVNILMHCKACDAREDIFLTEKEYKIHEKTILREVKDGI
tara:strand:+ start:134 stop:373 length:240 start_codon:yes stop_codon:yes gene_type:complete